MSKLWLISQGNTNTWFIHLVCDPSPFTWPHSDVTADTVCQLSRLTAKTKKKLTDRWANIHISYIVHAQQSFERLSAPRDSPLSAGVNQLRQRAHCQLEMQGARTHSRDSRGILTFDFSFAYFLFLFTRIDTHNCYDLFYRLQISIVIPHRYSTIFVISTKLLAYYIFILGLFVYVLHTYYI